MELAARIQKEIDPRAAIVSRGRTVVPNVFTIEFSPTDLQRLDMYAEQMRAELAESPGSTRPSSATPSSDRSM